MSYLEVMRRDAAAIEDRSADQSKSISKSAIGR